MTLVIDNAQYIMAKNAPFLHSLQEFAKESAVTGNLRVVFVSSDFAIVAHMRAHTSWSRCAKPPLEVGEEDVDEQQAVQLLISKRNWTTAEQTAAAGESTMLPGHHPIRQHRCYFACATHNSFLLPRLTAEYIVKHITGTRFAELLSVTDDYGTVAAAKEWEAGQHLHVKRVLRRHSIAAGHLLMSRMLESPHQSLTSGQLMDEIGLSEAQMESLVKHNILAAHPNERYTCAVRYVVGAFAALRGKAAEPTHAAPTAALPVAPVQEAAPSASECVGNVFE